MLDFHDLRLHIYHISVITYEYYIRIYLASIASMLKNNLQVFFKKHCGIEHECKCKTCHELYHKLHIQ